MSYSRYSAMLCTENKNMKNMLSLTPKDLRTSTLVSIRGWSDEPGLASQRRWPLSWALKERNYTLRKGRNKHMQRNRHEVAWVIIQCCWDLASGARAGEGKTGGWAEARWQACGSLNNSLYERVKIGIRNHIEKLKWKLRQYNHSYAGRYIYNT